MTLHKEPSKLSSESWMKFWSRNDIPLDLIEGQFGSIFDLTPALSSPQGLDEPNTAWCSITICSLCFVSLCNFTFVII